MIDSNTKPNDGPDLVATMAAVADVDGWMSPGQGATLFDAASRCPDGGTIVEIGSFRGRSTIVLAQAAASNVRIFAIDPHAGNDRGPQEIDGFVDEAADDHAVFLANLERAGVADRVTHVRAFSDDAHDRIDGGIDVLYVDGAHRYGPALADIRSWGDRVLDGGTMLIHDSFSSIGVTGAIMRSLVAGRRFRYVGRSRSMTIYRADLPSGLGARLRNASRQLAQLPWFAKNVGLKVLLTLKLGAVLQRVGRPAPEWPY
ncbi:MAG: class I SAM-dependent methyltransferase [Ilumatobacter sp.]|jgi:predicted O-methyltransferase YrrM|uniref:class I SAM-dependent methyltransferase n=1 Tax=Ilumatobacter sp. TaxID=1967498 RepID=UPI0039193D81